MLATERVARSITNSPGAGGDYLSARIAQVNKVVTTAEFEAIDCSLCVIVTRRWVGGPVPLSDRPPVMSSGAEDAWGNGLDSRVVSSSRSPTSAADPACEHCEMEIPQPMDLTVEGETFRARPDPDQPGAWHLTWLNGPNDGYGFTTRRSDHVWAERPALEEGIRSFLAEINPDTGYLAD